MISNINNNVSTMLDERGEPGFPIWLLGDSEPSKWAGKLSHPLDQRHPAIHNIWTPIISNVQGILYKKMKVRIDEEKIYIRNAIKNSEHKPKYKEVSWSQTLMDSLNNYRNLKNGNNPIIIFTFGSFSFEFARRVMNENEQKNWSYWNTMRLGTEFSKRIDQVKFNETNIIPLLHASIARGYFLSGHHKFTGISDGNYFNYTSEKISRAITNDDFLNKVCLQ